MVEEKLGHLFLGAEKELRLLMLRPIDIIEFTEFAGANAEDILEWVGKRLGKYFTENLFPDEDWEGEPLSTKKKVIITVIEVLELLGYGAMSATFKKDHILISVEEPITADEKDNIMSKNLCIVYQGIFSGILDHLDVDAEGQEVKCYLLDDPADIYKFDLLIDEFDDKDVDADGKSPAISDFLTSL